MAERIFIAGATVRSAAQSAVQAGWEVTAADLFCDRDTLACGAGYRVRHYPHDIAHLARQVPPCKWMYTGGLENAPGVVAAVSQYHTLLGNPPAVLRRVRDPWCLQQTLHSHGLLFPRISAQEPDSETGTWLCKPRTSCGGMNIRAGPWVSQTGCPSPQGEPGARKSGSYFFQKYVRGACHGALFLAAGCQARLLAITRQLTGCGWAGAGGFRYVGSIGPVAIAPDVTDQFQHIGQCVTEAFGLCGLFGVDAIVRDGRVWTIEVNPRFTASVEIYERASGFSAIQAHRLACEDGSWPAVTPAGGELHGKAIVFAKQEVLIDEPFCRWIDVQNQRSGKPVFADLPHAGTNIAPGDPILTVLAQGRRVAELYRKLRTQAHAVRAACARQHK